MLTVYSTYGSPGASTTALCIAAQYASSGRPTLLIDADGDAGSLGHLLGIQYTPGTASFLADGKPVTAESLIEHAQDMIFDDLHVMPTPSNPPEARDAVRQLSQFGSQLRDVSDAGMAVIIDGGRLTSEAHGSPLTTCAAAVLVVVGEATSFPSLEHVTGVLVGDEDAAGPLGLVATVGPSPLSADQWRTGFDLKLIGNVEINTERSIDLSMFMARAKRKTRRFRDSIAKLADSLYPYACPAEAETPRQRLAPAADDDLGADAAAGDGEPAAGDSGEPADEQWGYRLTTEPDWTQFDSAAGADPAAAVLAPEPAAGYADQAPYPSGVPPQPPADQAPYPSGVPPQPPADQAPYPSGVPSQPPLPPQPHAGQARHPSHDSRVHDSRVHDGQVHDGQAQGGEVYHLPVPGHGPQPHPEPPLDAPAAPPSGSFRSWAEQLFGESDEAGPEEDPLPPGQDATA
ncbi:MAG: hypothetical protein OXM54_00950 [Acidimicrobiaceae bacterium]|nr:hypothetical protein [Acidimicrobiaceae bacterium]